MWNTDAAGGRPSSQHGLDGWSGILKDNNANRNLFKKRKLQAKRAHCKENHHPQPTLPLDSVSNRDILKREIQYLESDQPLEQRYPRPATSKVKMEIQRDIQRQAEKPQTSEIRLHSLNKLPRDSRPAFLIQGFTNTFSNSFFAYPPKQAVQQHHQKYFRRNLSMRRKSQCKAEDKQSCIKVIHSKVQLIAPFKRYFHSNRKKEKHEKLVIRQMTGCRINQLVDYCHSFISL